MKLQNYKMVFSDSLIKYKIQIINNKYNEIILLTHILME